MYRNNTYKHNINIKKFKNNLFVQSQTAYSAIVDLLFGGSDDSNVMKQNVLAISQLPHRTNKEPRCRLEEAHTATTAWHPLLMLVTGLVTHCCGTASHSSTSTCRKSANVLVSVNSARPG